MVRAKKVHLPVLVEKDEDGFFVVECPLLQGCYNAGKNTGRGVKKHTRSD
ncbi:MAG: type II toxin-antitoxin system HicB family antitoxin [Candidatus Methanospirareceae archaeon]